MNKWIAFLFGGLFVNFAGAACTTTTAQDFGVDGQLLNGIDEKLGPRKVKAVVEGQPRALSLRETTDLVAFIEVPPILVPGAWRGFLLTSGWTVGCPTPANPLDGPVVFSNCTLASQSKMFNGYGNVSQSAMSPGSDWRQNYNGIYGAHLMRDEAKNYNWLVTVNHTELKNEWVPKYGGYANSYLNIDPAACASGEVNGAYQDCYKAYMAFVTSSWSSYDALSSWGLGSYQDDRGPILWPTAGYLDDEGAIVAPGPRHPSSIVWDGALWVFYLDQSPGSYGIKVARSTGGGVPGTFDVLKDGTFTEPALPKGFTKENIRNFLNVKGPQVAPLFAEEAGRLYNRFSVAKVKGEQRFVAVEETRLDGKWVTALRVSENLIQWSERYDLSGMPGDWAAAGLHYPVLVNKEFDNNYEVDLSDFMVIGTSAAGIVNTVRLSVTI